MNHEGHEGTRRLVEHRWHYWISLFLCAALVPVLRSQGLPLKFDWLTLGVAYWIVLAAQSIFVAALLAVIGLPGQQVWRPFLARYREQPLRIVALILYFGILTWTAGWVKALVLTVDAIALLELRDRSTGILPDVAGGLRRAGPAIFAPAVYLFFGFLMVLAYNSAIVSVRSNFAYDPALAAIDRFLLRGQSVSDIAHWAVGTLPLAFFRVLEFIYFGMFPQIGAALILVVLSDGRTRGLQFVGTILMSYYLALILFYLWPAQGPYYLCPEHFSRFPAALQSYNIQKTLIAHALARWRHEPLARISTDYYIGLPCMHIAQPLVVMWFLRRWKRMVIALAAYDFFLITAVVLLEWHYLIDIIAGIFVAALAIGITKGTFRRQNAEAHESPAGASGPGTSG
jgi:PAP2 superfamily protein